MASSLRILLTSRHQLRVMNWNSDIFENDYAKATELANERR
jgi:hypothetical protein